MAIDTQCPTCEKSYRLADNQRGKRVTCRHCAEVFVVGGGSPDDDVPEGLPLPDENGVSERSSLAPRGRSRRRDRDEDEDRPARRGSKSDPSSAPVVLIICLAVGIPLVVIFAIAGIVILTAASRSSVPVVQPPWNPPPVAVPNPPRFPLPPPPPNLPQPPPLVPQPAPPPGVPGKRTVDLVPFIDPNQDAVHGRWAVVNNVLQCNDAHFVPRVQIPYQPPAEYDFVVTFSQPALRNGISLIMPNPNGGSFFWYLGGNGSEYGFASNPNKGGSTPGLIEANRAYTTAVQVRRDGVKGLLDGRVLIDHRTDFRDLICDHWRTLKDASLLGVACDDPTVFHFVRLIEMTGNGRKTR